MSKEISQLAIGIVLVFVLIVVVLGSMQSTMVETGPAPEPSAEATPVGGGTKTIYSPEGGRVRGGSQSSGTSLFGLRFGGSWGLTIEFQVSNECYASVAVGNEWPVSVAGCESEVPVEGEITRTFESEVWGGLLVVEMGVSSDCRAVAVGGGHWPTGLAECASEERARLFD